MPCHRCSARSAARLSTSKSCPLDCEKTTPPQVGALPQKQKWSDTRGQGYSSDNARGLWEAESVILTCQRHILEDLPGGDL